MKKTIVFLCFFLPYFLNAAAHLECVEDCTAATDVEWVRVLTPDGLKVYKAVKYHTLYRSVSRQIMERVRLSEEAN